MTSKQSGTSMRLLIDHSRLFTASVIAGPVSGWVAVIDLGDGARVSHWFEEEEDARHYPDELAAWLAERSSQHFGYE
jgi:hypothetical protein